MGQQPRYSEEFKQKMVQRLLLPGAPSASELARDVGVNHSTLSRWLRDACGPGRFDPMPKDEKKPRRPRRPEDWDEKDRLRVVLEAGRLSGDELGAFLRREGLHEETLAAWRDEALAALSSPQAAGRQSTKERKRVEALERQLARKERELEAANALLDLSKKVRALWGDGDNDTGEKNDK